MTKGKEAMSIRTNHHPMSKALRALAAMGYLLLLIGRCSEFVVGVRTLRGPRLVGVAGWKAHTAMVGPKVLTFEKKTGSLRADPSEERIASFERPSFFEGR